MVNVMKGILVECDPAMKQFLLHLDETEALGRKFVIQDLDETHIFISGDILPVLRDRIDDLMDKLSFPFNEKIKKESMELQVVKNLESKALTWCWKIVKRRLGPDAALFEEGDVYLKLSSKYIPLDIQTDLLLNSVEEFPCGIANCSQKFNSVSKYEAHYNSCHRNVCQTCHRILPSPHLLEIHILEAHDVMFSLMAEKQDMYQCLLENCKERFRNTAARRDHMVKIHKYPSNYRYDQYRRKRSKKKDVEHRNGSGVAMETEAVIDPGIIGDEAQRSSQDPQATVTTGRMFSYKVPKNICFGQGVSRGFLGGRGRGRGKHPKNKHWYNKDKSSMDTTVDIESVDMSELSDALS